MFQKDFGEHIFPIRSRTWMVHK